MNDDCVNEGNELDEDRDAEQYQAELHHLVTEVSVVWFKGDWVVIVYEND